MFRLTAVLLVSLYAVMSIWGDPPEGDVVVARADAFSPTVAGLAAAPAAGAEPAEGAAEVSEQEAVELALAAGVKEKNENEVEAVEVAAQPAPEEEAEEESRFVYVTGSSVNLRRGPTSNSAVVGSMSLGDRAEPLSDLDESWVHIRTETGVEAWIYGRFLSETPA